MHSGALYHIRGASTALAPARAAPAGAAATGRTESTGGKAASSRQCSHPGRPPQTQRPPRTNPTVAGAPGSSATLIFPVLRERLPDVRDGRLGSKKRQTEMLPKK